MQNKHTWQKSIKNNGTYHDNQPKGIEPAEDGLFFTDHILEGRSFILMFWIIKGMIFSCCLFYDMPWNMWYDFFYPRLSSEKQQLGKMFTPEIFQKI